MQDLFGHMAGIWLLAGALLIAFEAFTTPGLGIFLAGLGAFCTGILIKGGVVAEHAAGVQFACFFGLTVLWTIGLWKPLKKFRTSRSNSVSSPYRNVVGQIAIVGKGGLTRGSAGQALWSGTLMTAELDPASPADYLPEGANVIICAVTGTTLNVIPQ